MWIAAGTERAVVLVRFMMGCQKGEDSSPRSIDACGDHERIIISADRQSIKERPSPGREA